MRSALRNRLAVAAICDDTWLRVAISARPVRHSGGMMSLTRRLMLKSAAFTVACSAIRPLFSLAQTASNNDDKQFHGLRVGVCSYSLRSFPLTETLQDIKRLGVR